MKRFRTVSLILLGALLLSALGAEWIAPAAYDRQFREAPNAAPSRSFLLGTDELGRDRFSRLLYGTRISLLLAPAAALLTTLIAALVGGLAGWFGGWTERIMTRAMDVFLSLPWFFLLIAVRAMLPLNVTPIISVMITFALLGLLGWAGPARVLCAGARALRNSGFVLQAKASGCRPLRIALMHLVPNLKPVLFAQFWISVPVFILAEANLSLLGLGVAEPLPSWGGMLREMEHYHQLGAQPVRVAALILLVLTMAAFQLIQRRDEATA